MFADKTKEESCSCTCACQENIPHHCPGFSEAAFKRSSQGLSAMHQADTDSSSSSTTPGFVHLCNMHPHNHHNHYHPILTSTLMCTLSKRLSLLILTPSANQARRKQKEQKDKVASPFLTSFRDFSVRLLFPVQSAEGLPFILEIQFVSLSCAAVPPFLLLVPCRKRGSVQNIPFFYSAVPVDTRLHAVDDGDKEGDRKQREDASSLDLFSSSPPSPLVLRSHTLKQAHEGRRQSLPGSDVCVFAPRLLTSSFPPCSLPLFVSACCRPSLLVPLSVARWFTL
ncbi:unnamed protein product [Pleuronectes platessa]|uniref:Uncharacterized protein n=1 Tax=Pleuronectes platessa TaxID=8262 RepID=A0A9N7Y6A1_PLEPL|nr:unnamed protein product [Pleuronectes platessa]